MNNDAYSLTEVKCPITEATFKLVKNDVPGNIILFNEWTNDIINRSKSGKMINIAIDCEGFNLGNTPDSLGCIQIGEIFNDSFNIRNDSHPPEVGTKRGFIILTPISEDIKINLSKILENTNVIIYTFDFTNDFAAILNEGIKINFDNVFDSQVAAMGNQPTILFNTKVRGLKWFVNESSELDPLAPRAVELLKPNKKNYFDVSSFLFKDLKNPAQEIMTKTTLEVGAADIYMTGLAAVYCIIAGNSDLVFDLTKKKVNEFHEYIRKCNSVLAPSVEKDIAFFNFYSAKNYSGHVKMNDSTEQDLLNLLTIFRDTDVLITAEKILKYNYNGKLQISKAKSINESVVQKLNANRKRLQQMLQKYS